MRPTRYVAGSLTALALMATPALAVQPTSPGHSQDKGQSQTHKPATPGPSASPQSKAKAYGRYCAGQSKQHVKGQKGTAFSRCVTAMAKVAKDDSVDPKVACRTLSKKHVKGQKGTAYSRCVSGAAKLRADRKPDQS